MYYPSEKVEQGLAACSQKAICLYDQALNPYNNLSGHGQRDHLCWTFWSIKNNLSHRQSRAT